MMLNVDTALRKPTVMRALTSMNPDEFQALVPTFSQVWAEQTQTNWAGQARQRARGGGPDGELARPEDKLFFILVYLRLYLTQEVMGALFGFGQAQANKWIMRLLPLLHETLRRHKVLPRRDTRGLGALLAAGSDWRLLVDGTDRPVRRPQDPQQQRRRYNGRKKRHTVKNVVLTQDRQVRYLSPTAEGRQAEKPLAQPLEQTKLPANKAVITDTGFQGMNVHPSIMVQPEKKPKGQPRPERARRWNRLVAKLRVEAEHVIGGVKRCRVVSDLFRQMKQGLEDLVMEIASGLYNFVDQHRMALRGAT